MIFLYLLISIAPMDVNSECLPILTELSKANTYQEAKREVEKLRNILASHGVTDFHYNVWNRIMDSISDINMSDQQQMELLKILGLVK